MSYEFLDCTASHLSNLNVPFVALHQGGGNIVLVMPGFAGLTAGAHRAERAGLQLVTTFTVWLT